MSDLITLDRARQNLPSSVNADEPQIATLITAASQAVQRWCRRDFNSTSYDELYHGSGERLLTLRHYPIISVESIRHDAVAVMTITNTSSSNQQARVSVTNSGLSLKRVASGVATPNTLTFAANVTLSALKTAVDALGNGWSATVVGAYGSWPSADLLAIQGAANAAGFQAELMMHVSELTRFDVDTRRGWVWRGSQSDDGCELVWPCGINNFRVQYTAGYSTVPEDVQEATAEWVATLFKDLGRNQNLAAESTVGVFSASALAGGDAKPPRSIRCLLAPYRKHSL